MVDEIAPVALSIRNLAVHFVSEQGTVRALEGVDFDLRAGRTMGLVGESGCGKSVTARAVLQLVDRPGRIVSGSIHLGDDAVDILSLPAESPAMRAIRGRRIGLIFQEPMAALSMHYTVGNQIIEAIRQCRGLDKKAAREAAIGLLADVGIPRPEMRIDSYPFQLSGGLRQRVGIALALAGEPEILIADEPTTALDVTTQAQILSLLHRLQTQRKMSMILITHDMGVIAEMADDVAVMYAGRVVEYATVEKLFAAPRHPYTRALLRSVPSVLAQSRERLATIRGAVPPPGTRLPGCPFEPRCAEAIADRCAKGVPPPVPAGAAGASCFREEAAAE